MKYILIPLLWFGALQAQEIQDFIQNTGGSAAFAILKSEGSTIAHSQFDYQFSSHTSIGLSHDHLLSSDPVNDTRSGDSELTLNAYGLQLAMLELDSTRTDLAKVASLNYTLSKFEMSEELGPGYYGTLSTISATATPAMLFASDVDRLHAVGSLSFTAILQFGKFHFLQIDSPHTYTTKLRPEINLILAPQLSFYFRVYGSTYIAVSGMLGVKWNEREEFDDTAGFSIELHIL